MSGDHVLKIDGMDIHYGDLLAVRDISLSVWAGQIVSIIGANGAGKSTILKAVAGLLNPKKGCIAFMGQDITQCMAFQVVSRGISLVPEGRHIFPRLTVKENLLIGAYTPRTRQGAKRACQKIYALFPILEERKNQLGVNLSGGEQQMLAVGRALMSDPKLILFDEISLGLSPHTIKILYEKIKEINQKGIAVVLVEQDIQRSMKASSWTYILQDGRIALQGRPGDLTETEIKKAYFGSSASWRSTPQDADRGGHSWKTICN